MLRSSRSFGSCNSSGTRRLTTSEFVSIDKKGVILGLFMLQRHQKEKKGEPNMSQGCSKSLFGISVGGLFCFGYDW